MWPGRLVGAAPASGRGSAGQLCGRAGDSVGTREGFSVCWGKMTQCEGAGGGRGCQETLGRCLQSNLALAQAPSAQAVPAQDPARSPRRPFFPPRRRCACARDAGRGARGAGRCLPAQGSRGDARRRKDTQAGRGAQVPWAGTRVPPPAGPRHLLGRPPRPSAPACAPQAPLTGSWARPTPWPRLQRLLSLQAGALRATIRSKDGKARAQGGLAGGAGRDPPRQARAAAECSPRSAPAAAGDAARWGLGAPEPHSWRSPFCPPGCARARGGGACACPSWSASAP